MEEASPPAPLSIEGPEVPESEPQESPPVPRSKCKWCIALMVVLAFFAIIACLAVAFSPDLSYVATGNLGSSQFNSSAPTRRPTKSKAVLPTTTPTEPTTISPTTASPIVSLRPTRSPTARPSNLPTTSPSTSYPSPVPSTLAPYVPSPAPSISPSSPAPTRVPSTTSTLPSGFASPSTAVPSSSPPSVLPSPSYPSAPSTAIPSSVPSRVPASYSLSPSSVYPVSAVPTLIASAPTSLIPTLAPATGAAVCSLNTLWLGSQLCEVGKICVEGTCRAINLTTDQAGNLFITEFRTLGGYTFVEIYNSGNTSVDIAGFSLISSNFVGTIRSSKDVVVASRSVFVEPYAYAFGVPNPLAASSIPTEAQFVWGEPSNLTLVEGGDRIALFSLIGLEDYLDFSSFHSDPLIKQPENFFPGFVGCSTQFAPDSSVKNTAITNDNWQNWCVTYFNPQPSPFSRINDTAGSANGNCGRVVINEVLIEGGDGQSFIELAGPGGALVGGYKIRDVEGGDALAGELNFDGNFDMGETDGVIILPPSTRIPVSGILLLADRLGADQLTNVSNFNPEVGLLFADVSMESGGGDSIVLWDDNDVQIDAVGYGVMITGAIYEGSSANYPTFGAALVRSALSVDSQNNSADFYIRCATPGKINSLDMPIITSLIPNNSGGNLSTVVEAVGEHLCAGMSVKVGESAIFNVTQGMNNRVIVKIPATADPPLRVNVSYGFLPFLTELGVGFWTWTVALNGLPGEFDGCILKSNESVVVSRSTRTEPISAWLYQGNDKFQGPRPGLLAEVGFGPSGTVPMTSNRWIFFSASYSAQVDVNAQFEGSFIAPPTAGQYALTYRFSRNDGLSWTYCDKDGAGALYGPATLMFNLTVV